MTPGGRSTHARRTPLQNEEGSQPDSERKQALASPTPDTGTALFVNLSILKTYQVDHVSSR